MKRPVELTVPPPDTDQVKAGWVASAVANWSRAVAVNCCVAEVLTVALAGVTSTLDRVWLTTTVTLLVTVWLA